ncbi:acyl carrier protein phosphodiesterase [Reichenbachiella versicolor]|uniref:acyl carrier protein phosphodiesterase n=1 Tax=Reichenbachiella versicolor TaxID=1821036 RepID=UPI000D6E3375|nr:ACP phosphodiesterase [Reichenbachiella versicolor]
MNFLAHLYLSFDNEEIAVGNFIADTVKGRKYTEFPKGIQNGILIHREIDRYTDSHEIVKAGKRRLSEYRHYSSVIIDIFYDHFLAKNWHQYSKEPLDKFTKRNYQLIYDQIDVIPEKAKHILSYMEPGDWLYNYQFMEGIEFALNGMSRRSSYTNNMDMAIKDLKRDYKLLEKEFRVFFIEVMDHIHNFTDQLVNK